MSKVLFPLTTSAVLCAMGNLLDATEMPLRGALPPGVRLVLLALLIVLWLLVLGMLWQPTLNHSARTCAWMAAGTALAQFMIAAVERIVQFRLGIFATGDALLLCSCASILLLLAAAIFLAPSAPQAE